MAVLALDIGGTHIRSALFSAPTAMSQPVAVRHEQLGIPLSVPTFLDYVAARLTQVDGPVTAIGISIAAVVDSTTGHVKVSENVGWRDVPLKCLLEERCGLPVAVDVDAFCGGRAEAAVGSGAGIDHFLYVVIGTGIGHALVLNGKVWHGLHAAANVFGHIKVVPDGEACYCGGQGCVCQYASGRGLARLGEARRGEPVVGEQVVAAAEAGAAWAVTAVDEALRRLAFALSAAYNLLDIECVVFGGGAVTERFPDLDRLAALVEPLVYPEIRPIALRRGALGGNAAITGAALLALERSSS